MLLFPPPGGYVFTSVCLFVCLLVCKLCKLLCLEEINENMLHDANCPLYYANL